MVVSAVSASIKMQSHTKCTNRNRRLGAQGTRKPVDGVVLLTSTGKSYVFGAFCEFSYGTQSGPPGVDIGDTTKGLKNKAGSLGKRERLGVVDASCALQAGHTPGNPAAGTGRVPAFIAIVFPALTRLTEADQEHSLSSCAGVDIIAGTGQAGAPLRAAGETTTHNA